MGNWASKAEKSQITDSINTPEDRNVVIGSLYLQVLTEMGRLNYK